VLDVASAKTVVIDVQHAKAAAGEEGAGDDAAELRADDADVVDALGCGGLEGLGHGAGSLAQVGPGGGVGRRGRAGKGCEHPSHEARRRFSAAHSTGGLTHAPAVTGATPSTTTFLPLIDSRPEANHPIAAG
jgi:hypothetical protein